MPLFAPLYRKNGSLSGMFAVQQGDAAPNNNTLRLLHTGNDPNSPLDYLIWAKQASANLKERSYRQGFVMPLLLWGECYNDWRAQTLADVLGPEVALSFDPTRSSAEPGVRVNIQINRVQTPPAGSEENPCRTRLRIVRRQGVFRGSFRLSDHVGGSTVSRNVSFEGVLLPDGCPMRNETNRLSTAEGFYLMPGLDPSTRTSPIESGRVWMTPAE